jgi:hypothetical protein
VVAADKVAVQKPITFDVPKSDATDPVPPSGVIVELADGMAELVTGEVVTGNVANGDVIDGEAAEGDAVEDDATDAIAGKITPVALAPFAGHMVMLPNAGA